MPLWTIIYRPITARPAATKVERLVCGYEGRLRTLGGRAGGSPGCKKEDRRKRKVLISSHHGAQGHRRTDQEGGVARGLSGTWGRGLRLGAGSRSWGRVYGSPGWSRDPKRPTHSLKLSTAPAFISSVLRRENEVTWASPCPSYPSYPSLWPP